MPQKNRRNTRMSIKKKLGMGIASAVLGVSLIGGGTFAYFSDAAETEANFATGTLQLEANTSTIIDVDNLKPGDWMNRSFELVNDGSLDISRVLLDTSYTGDTELAEHIRVNFLLNADKVETPFASVMLDELANMDSDVVYQHWLKELLGFEKHGLKSGDSDKLYVQFEFVDNNQDQNYLQDKSLEVKWTFNAEQTKGERR